MHMSQPNAFKGNHLANDWEDVAALLGSFGVEKNWPGEDEVWVKKK